MVEDRRLKTFVTVAQMGSFSRAAAALYVTQSTVTARIADLEASVGVPLFKREGRGVSLTEAGRVFLRYAQRVLQTLEDARTALAAADGAGEPVLRIMASHIPAVHDLPRCLGPFLQGATGGRRGGFPLRVEVASSKRIFRKMLQGEADVGLVQLRFRHPDLETTIVAERPLAVVASPRAFPAADALFSQPYGSHSDGKEGSVHSGWDPGTGGADGARFAVFYFQEELEDALTIRSICHQLGIPDMALMGISDMTALKEFLEVGLGLGIVPRISVARELDQGSLVEVMGGAASALPRFLTCLLVRKDSLRGPNQALVDAFRQRVVAYYRNPVDSCR